MNDIPTTPPTARPDEDMRRVTALGEITQQQIDESSDPPIIALRDTQSLLAAMLLEKRPDIEIEDQILRNRKALFMALGDGQKPAPVGTDTPVTCPNCDRNRVTTVPLPGLKMHHCMDCGLDWEKGEPPKPVGTDTPVSGSNDAEAICHDEQLEIWADEFLLHIMEWIKDRESYDDNLNLIDATKDAIKDLVEKAFTHPELEKAPVSGSNLRETIERVFKEYLILVCKECGHGGVEVCDCVWMVKPGSIEICAQKAAEAIGGSSLPDLEGLPIDNGVANRWDNSAWRKKVLAMQTEQLPKGPWTIHHGLPPGSDTEEWWIESATGRLIAGQLESESLAYFIAAIPAREAENERLRKAVTFTVSAHDSQVEDKDTIAGWYANSLKEISRLRSLNAKMRELLAALIADVPDSGDARRVINERCEARAKARALLAETEQEADRETIRFVEREFASERTTMLQRIDRLRSLNAKMREALAESPCPRDNGTVRRCMAALTCGCDSGAMLAKTEESNQ